MGLGVALHHTEQHQVDETAGEGHAHAHIQNVHQHEGQTGQHAVHRVHGQCHKDKGKFQRLGDAGEESRQRSRQQQAACRLFLFRLGALVHRQRCAGQTEHHKGELTGHETGSADREHRGGLGSQLGKEDVLCAGHGDAIDDGGAAHSGLPERHIEHMMQSKGDQRTLQQTVNKGACVAGSQHQCAQRGNTALHHRPDIEHGNADHQIHDGADDGHEAGAAEEGQHLRQLDLIELVVQRRHAQTDHDAAEHTHLQGRDAQHGGGGVGGHCFYAACRIDHGLNGCIHNDIGHCAGQGGHLFFLAGHADGHAHGEQQGQIVEHGAAGLAHHVQNGVDQGTGVDDAVQAIGRQHGFVGERAADTQQQARYRQQCNGQHKAASHALQHAKDLVFHLQFSFFQIRIQQIYPHAGAACGESEVRRCGRRAAYFPIRMRFR